LIAKVIPAKTRGRTFCGLVDYVTAENRLDRPKGREFDELVRYVGREDTVDSATGEVSAKAIAIETQGVASLRTAAIEMEAVAAQCRRLRAPADYHLVVSWHEQERPTPEQAFAAGKHALAALGMQSHQYVMAVHGDTANAHLHIAANRVDPESYRAVSPFRDYIKLDRAMRDTELAQGWSHDRGPTLVREIEGRAPEIVLAFKDQTLGRGLDEPALIKQKARDLQSWPGDRPFTEWVREAAPALKATLAREGARLEDVRLTLADFCLELRTKGSGLVVVHHDDTQLVAKASQIARFMSRENLEQRLGPLAERIPSLQPAPKRLLERGAEIAREILIDPPPGRGRGRDVGAGREDLRRQRALEAEQREEKQHQAPRREPSRDYKRDSERRIDRRVEPRQGRERLYADFRAARDRADAGRKRWDEQRASERARYAEIRARKVVYRRELRETRLAPQIAVSLVALLAAREGADLRGEIARERAALKRELPIERRQAWREFVAEHALAGDEAAISALRGLRYRDRHREFDDERVCGLRGGVQEPRVVSDLRDLAARVERNGEVSYRWKVDAREAFRDLGQQITFADTSDASIAAGLDLAHAKWGQTVQLTGPLDYQERALRIAIERGMRVSNVELHDRQRQIIEELERARELLGQDIVRVCSRDPYGLGGEVFAVDRWDAQEQEWTLQDYPPIFGNVQLGEVHVVRVFANGQRDVEDGLTQKLRAETPRELGQQRAPAQERSINRGGMRR